MDVRLSREQELICATAARLGAQHAISGIRDLPPTPERIGCGMGRAGASSCSGLPRQRTAASPERPLPRRW